MLASMALHFLYANQEGRTTGARKVRPLLRLNCSLDNGSEKVRDISTVMQSIKDSIEALGSITKSPFFPLTERVYSLDRKFAFHDLGEIGGKIGNPEDIGHRIRYHIARLLGNGPGSVDDKTVKDHLEGQAKRFEAWAGMEGLFLEGPDLINQNIAVHDFLVRLVLARLRDYFNWG